MKYGKADMTNMASTGKPVRLQSQLNQLLKRNPTKDIEGEVIYFNRNISTFDIKQVETQYIQEFYDKYGFLPPKNQGHPGIFLKE